MPQMNGAEFMVEVSERWINNHHWQVYLTTSKKFTDEEKLSMMTLGITHVFEKPLKKSDIKNALEEMIP